MAREKFSQWVRLKQWKQLFKELSEPDIRRSAVKRDIDRIPFAHCEKVKYEFMTVSYYHATCEFQIESTLCTLPECQRTPCSKQEPYLTSLAKWLSVRLRTKWLRVWITLLSPKLLIWIYALCRTSSFH